MSNPNDLLPLLRATMRMMGKRDYDVNAYAPLEQWEVNDLISYYGQDKSAFMSNPILARIISKNNFSMRTMMTNILTRKDGVRCLVYFAPIANSDPRGNIALETMDDFVALMDLYNAYPQYKIHKGIIISKGKLSAKARIALVKHRKTRSIQHFQDEDVLVDPTIHIYNPPMKILNDQEARAFIVDNNLEIRSMAQNLDDETLSKYLGAEPGNITEYERFGFLPAILADKEIFHRFMRRAVERKKPVIRKV